MNTLLSLKNNVSKIQNLIISGEVGATGPTGHKVIVAPR